MKKAFGVALALLLAAAGPAFAKYEPVTAQVVTEKAAMRAGEAFYAGVLLVMKKDWHTYWINPGDGGLPTTVEWQLPEGFTAGPLEWPYPHYFNDDEVASYGYTGEVLLMAQITPSPSVRMGKDVPIAAKVAWLACNKICVPGKADLTFLMPVTVSVPARSEWVERFKKARRDVPVPLEGWKTSFFYEEKKMALQVSPQPWTKGAVRELMFFPFEEAILEYAVPQTLKQEGPGYRILMEPSAAINQKVPGLKGVLVGNEGWTGQPGKAFVVEVLADNATKQ